MICNLRDRGDEVRSERKSKIVVYSEVMISRVVVGFEHGSCVRWKKECTAKLPHTNGRMTGLGPKEGRSASYRLYTVKFTRSRDIEEQTVGLRHENYHVARVSRLRRHLIAKFSHSLKSWSRHKRSTGESKLVIRQTHLNGDALKQSESLYTRIGRRIRTTQN